MMRSYARLAACWPRSQGGHRLGAALLSLALTAAPQQGWAACSLNVQGVIFGGYDVFSSQHLESTGNVAVTCDVSTPYSISLSTGGGSYGSRTLTSGARTLNYNLYSDVARTSIWGDGMGGTALVGGSGTSANHAIYGRIPAGQNAYVGNYTDTITVTLSF